MAKKHKYWLVKCKECNGTGKMPGKFFMFCSFCFKGFVKVKK